MHKNTFIALAAAVAIILKSGCDSGVVQSLEDGPLRGSSRDLCPLLEDLASNEFALRWRDDSVAPDTSVRYTLWPDNDGFSESIIRRQPSLEGSGGTTCYEVLPLTYRNDSGRHRRYERFLYTVKADHPVDDVRHAFEFESGYYTVDIDLERYRDLHFFNFGYEPDSLGGSETWVRLRNDIAGTVREFNAYVGTHRFQFAQLAPGVITPYVNVEKIFNVPGRMSMIVAFETITFQITDFVGSTPEPPGYYTLPIDTIGFWRYRDTGSIQLDRQ